jgi:hypothetical protein
LGFQSRFNIDDKYARDRFLVLLTQGIYIRRHQAYKQAETVRLFSTRGCRDIQWEKPKKANSKNNSSSNDGKTKSNKVDRGVFDCCIAGKHIVIYIYDQ